MVKEAFLSKRGNPETMEVMTAWKHWAGIPVCVSEHSDLLVGRDMPWDTAEILHIGNI